MTADRPNSDRVLVWLERPDSSVLVTPAQKPEAPEPPTLPETHPRGSETPAAAAIRALCEDHALHALETTAESLPRGRLGTLVRVREWSGAAETARWALAEALRGHADRHQRAAGERIRQVHAREARHVAKVPHPAWGDDRDLFPAGVIAMLMRSDRQILGCAAPATDAAGPAWDFPAIRMTRDEAAGDALARGLPDTLGVHPRSAEFVVGVTDAFDRGSTIFGIYVIRRWDGAPHGRQYEALRWMDLQTFYDSPRRHLNAALAVDTLASRLAAPIVKRH